MKQLITRVPTLGIGQLWLKCVSAYQNVVFFLLSNLAHTFSIKTNAAKINSFSQTTDCNNCYTSFIIRYKINKEEIVRLHIHPHQTEIFKVIEGELTYHIYKKIYKAGTGSIITLPAGIPHAHYNESDEELLLEQTICGL